jgi:hypothetical protein
MDIHRPPLYPPEYYSLSVERDIKDLKDRIIKLEKELAQLKISK